MPTRASRKSKPEEELEPEWVEHPPDPELEGFVILPGT